MRISDWSSDVCSSDLASMRVGAADVYVLGNLGVAETTGDLERVGERVIRLRKSCIAFVGDVIVRKARARRIDQSELLCLASLPPMFVAVKTAGDEFEIADAGKTLHFLRELVRIAEITRPHDFEPRLIIVLLVVSRRVAKFERANV